MSWLSTFERTVVGAEFYGPRDLGNPAPGQWCVVGPTGEYRTSSRSMDHAAQLYLVQVCGFSTPPAAAA